MVKFMTKMAFTIYYCKTLV